MTLNDVLLSLLEAMGATGEPYLVGWDAVQQWPDGALNRMLETGILNGNGWKPKGMHWNAFERLTAQHDAFVQISLAGMAAKLNLLEESLDDWT